MADGEDDDDEDEGVPEEKRLADDVRAENKVRTSVRQCVCVCVCEWVGHLLLTSLVRVSELLSEWVDGCMYHEGWVVPIRTSCRPSIYTSYRYRVNTYYCAISR